jgi:hypothetical protein
MLKISELKKGDVVWECDYGQNMRLEIQSNPQHITKLHGNPAIGWHATATTDKGELIDLFASDEASHYGPKLYRESMYATRAEINAELQRIRSQQSE